MKTVTVYDGMSLFDVAIYWCGNVTYAWQIARDNNLSMTHTFDNEIEVLVPNEAYMEAQALRLTMRTMPATGITQQNIWIDEDVWNDVLKWID
jgi:hypothetical protein